MKRNLQRVHTSRNILLLWKYIILYYIILYCRWNNTYSIADLYANDQQYDIEGNIIANRIRFTLETTKHI